jgi:hypothetical protein
MLWCKCNGCRVFEMQCDDMGSGRTVGEQTRVGERAVMLVGSFGGAKFRSRSFATNV